MTVHSDIRIPQLKGDQSWKAQARCRGLDPELFFLGETERSTKDAYDVCAKCPVMEQCREWAVINPAITHGVWGGWSARRIRRERGRRLRERLREERQVG